jgi:hypothetical protein
MSNPEVILEFLEGFPGGVCDDCVSRETHVEPRQQVNQICRRLEEQGMLTRQKGPCGLGPHTKVLNIIRRVMLTREQTAEPFSTAIEVRRTHLVRFCKALAEKHRFQDG